MQKKNITKFKAEYCHVFLLFKLFCNLHLYLFLRKVIIPTFVKKYRQSKWNHLSRPDLCGATTRSEIPNLSIAARCWLSLGRVSLVLVAGFSITNVISQQNGKSPNWLEAITDVFIPRFHQAGWKKKQNLVLNQAGKAWKTDFESL